MAHGRQLGVIERYVLHFELIMILSKCWILEEEEEERRWTRGIEISDVGECQPRMTDARVAPLTLTGPSGLVRHEALQGR